MRHMMTMLTLVCLLPTPTISSAQDLRSENNHVMWIGLSNGTKAEAVIANELRNLMRTYSLEPWIITRKILIDKDQIPHSHPVLTIHTRHIGEELELLATFIHEQLHWLEEEPWLEDFRAAMKDLERIFPEVPSSAEGGARDKQSTYRHLLVCDMELQALTTLIGEKAARDTLSRATHYEWIYGRVLGDPRIRKVALRHGFNVAEGIPSR